MPGVIDVEEVGRVLQVDRTIRPFESRNVDAFGRNPEWICKGAHRCEVDHAVFTAHEHGRVVCFWCEWQVIDRALDNALSGRQDFKRRTVNQHAGLENPATLVVNTEVEKRPPDTSARSVVNPEDDV